MSLAACKSEQALTTTQIAKKLKVKEFDFEYLTIKSRLRFNDGGKEQKVICNMRIKKDSAIWMMITKAAVEGVRVLATPDSIMILDRLNKQYYASDFEQLKKRFNFEFDFQMLQSVITGNIYLQSDKTPKPQKTDAFFIVRELIDGIAVENQISRANNKLAQVKVMDSKKNQLLIEYDDFKTVEKQLISHHNTSSLKYVKDGEERETELELNYTKVSLPSKPLKFPLKISSKYKKMEW